MDSSQTVDYQASQVNSFMAGINKDLEDHVRSNSNKYAFNFVQEKPSLQKDAEFDWFEISPFSKSEAAGKKPRMMIHQDRKSTAADTTLHSIQPDILSARGHENTSMLSLETSQAHVFANRQSSLFSVTPYHAQQICPSSNSMVAQRFAGPSVRPQEIFPSRECIPEERESLPSPYQHNKAQFYCRESLAELPEEEGQIQSVDNMTFGTPFSAASGQALRCRQIPISNSRGVTATEESLASVGATVQTGNQLAMHMQELHVGQANHQAHMGCDTENAEMNIENLADSDGPSDTAGLRVYAMNKPYTNIETLDNCLTAQKPAQSGLASPSMSQLK